MTTKKILTEKDKQFTVLPTEKNPATSRSFAQHAINKALMDIRKTKKRK